MKDFFGIIYKITNLVNGKIYIGQTVRDLKFRKYDYNKDYKRYKYGINAAIAKYGLENFKFEEIDVCYNRKDLDEKEILWIEKHNSLNGNIGYNLTLGGRGAGKWTQKKKEEYSIKRKGFNKGRKLSEESKQKIKDSWIIRKEKGQYRQKGFKHSEESRRKIRDNRLGKYTGGNNPNSKKVICLETECVFSTITEAANFVNRRSSTLSSHLNGVTKKCGGKTFKYI